MGIHIKEILLSFPMTAVGAVLGRYSKRHSRLKLLMYSGDKYRLSQLLLHFMLFGPLPFVCLSFAAVFATFWIIQGSSYIKEALGCRKLDLSDL